MHYSKKMKIPLKAGFSFLQNYLRFFAVFFFAAFFFAMVVAIRLKVDMSTRLRVFAIRHMTKANIFIRKRSTHHYRA